LNIIEAHNNSLINCSSATSPNSYIEAFQKLAVAPENASLFHKHCGADYLYPATSGGDSDDTIVDQADVCNSRK